jgi:hypothetical protein
MCAPLFSESLLAFLVQGCISQTIQSERKSLGKASCPLCRAPVTPETLAPFDEVAEKLRRQFDTLAGAGAMPESPTKPDAPSEGVSAKLEALISAIKQLIAGQLPSFAVKPTLTDAVPAPDDAATQSCSSTAADTSLSACDISMVRGSSSEASQANVEVPAPEVPATMELVVSVAVPVETAAPATGEQALDAPAESVPAPGSKRKGRAKTPAPAVPEPPAEDDGSIRRSKRARTARFSYKEVEADYDEEAEGKPTAAEKQSDDEFEPEKKTPAARRRPSTSGAVTTAKVAPPPPSRPAVAGASTSGGASTPTAPTRPSRPGGFLTGMRTKSVVFSQFTSFLDIIAERLDAEGISYVRLDGSMSANARNEAVNAFQTNPHVHVFLASLKAGGVGLTLTAGTNCFLTDVWWSPGAQDQAIDRIHRMGQTSPVHIYLMVGAGTIEERIIELQERKRAMASGMFGGVRSAEDIRRMKLDDIALLMSAGKGTTTRRLTSL